MSDQPYFLPYQREWLADNHQIKFWEKSRRIGATYAQAWEDVRDLVENEETGHLSQPKVWFSSADESAAKEYIDYCAHWAGFLNIAAERMGEKVLDEDKDVKAKVLEIPGVGVINALSSNPSRFRSKGGKAIVDEFAIHEHQEEMWDAVFPLTTWGDPLRVMSTHMGKRLFYDLVQDAKAGKRDFSVHTVTLLDAVEQGLVSRIKDREVSDEERQAFIDRIRNGCRDDQQWLQEYMCQPVDEASAFLTYEMISAVEDASVTWSGSPREHADGSELYLGMDVGRHDDLSVIWLVERIGRMLFTRRVDVLEKMPFSAQRDRLHTYLDLPGMRRGCIDATGLGMQLAEEAKEQFGRHRVEEINFTNSWKEEAAYTVRRRVEDKTLAIPAADAIRDDLHSLRKTTTPGGNLRFDVQGGDGHADRFWALALACHAAEDYSGEPRAASRSVKASRGSTMDRFGGDTDVLRSY